MGKISQHVVLWLAPFPAVHLVRLFCAFGEIILCIFHVLQQVLLTPVEKSADQGIRGNRCGYI